MPGGICSCLQDVYEKVIAMGPDGNDDLIIELLKGKIGWRRSTNPYLNYLGICSYFDREWTRQELLYGGTIRVVRTKTDELPCVSDEVGADDMADFASQLYDRQKRDLGFGNIMKAGFAFWHNAYDAIEDWKWHTIWMRGDWTQTTPAACPELG